MSSISSISSVSRTRNSLAGEVHGGYRVPFRERLHVGDETPDLIVPNAPAPRRHAVGPSLVDGLEHVAGRAAKMPAPVLQARTHATRATVAVTIETVIRHEELSTFGDALRVALVRVHELRPA